jgi:hypothetical protein
MYSEPRRVARENRHDFEFIFGQRRKGDILEARGELDEALRIRQGDVRSRAVTLGKVADILEARGELDEALRIRREVLPVFERLGDVRSRAVTELTIRLAFAPSARKALDRFLAGASVRLEVRHGRSAVSLRVRDNFYDRPISQGKRASTRAGLSEES